MEPIKTSRHCFDFLLLLFLLAAFSSCPLKCFIMFCSPELINHRLPCCSTWLWVPYSSSGLFVFFLGCLSFSELLLSFFLLPEIGGFVVGFWGGLVEKKIIDCCVNIRKDLAESQSTSHWKSRGSREGRRPSSVYRGAKGIHRLPHKYLGLLVRS